uniref:Uncharacterized protein n=1 Tax=Glycine max TaxID=3847 RepID=A0A0R0GUN4_SOYBN
MFLTRLNLVGKGLSKDDKAQKLALQHWREAIDPRHRYGHNLHMYYDILLVYKKDGRLVDTDEKSKWIFVLSTTRTLYVGRKQKGTFQHSSFLSGGATTAAAGRLLAHQGALQNFKEFISFLEEHSVDLTNRCAIDDDTPSLIGTNSFTATNESQQNMDPTLNSHTGPASAINANDSNMHKKDDAATFNLSKRLPCKWFTGAGPRIGSVRDYAGHLQSRALEQVNLFPRPTSARLSSYGPIPSPRPSPKVRMPPRLAYIGLPSPRNPIPAVS